MRAGRPRSQEGTTTRFESHRAGLAETPANVGGHLIRTVASMQIMEKGTVATLLSGALALPLAPTERD